MGLQLIEHDGKVAGSVHGLNAECFTVDADGQSGLGPATCNCDLVRDVPARIVE